MITKRKRIRSRSAVLGVSLEGICDASQEVDYPDESTSYSCKFMLKIRRKPMMIKWFGKSQENAIVVANWKSTLFPLLLALTREISRRLHDG